MVHVCVYQVINFIVAEINIGTGLTSIVSECG